MKKIISSFGRLFKILDDSQFVELMIIAALILLCGTLFYNYVEGWGILDSLYFSVTTLTTVGYGDLAIQEIKARWINCLKKNNWLC